MVWIWVGFLLFVLGMLALDLGVFHRKAHVVKVREALAWSGVWIALALAFTVFVYFAYERHWMGLGLPPAGDTTAIVDAMAVTAQNPQGINDGRSAVVKYLTGYVVEKSLSVDNIFVIAMIFGFFAVPQLYQHRVLFWGILGALLLRGVMIAIGAKLIAEFTWVLYVFGAFLIITAVKMMVLKTDHADPNQNWVVKLTRKFFPITANFHGQHFIVRAGAAASHEGVLPGQAEVFDPIVAEYEKTKPGAILFTPLMLALILVEFTDVIFAVDSIPAIFAITADPFLVFTSNVFAILGLRSLYFALAGMMDKFRYLKVSLAIVLGVIGAKMLAHSWLKAKLGPNFNVYLLLLVLGILALGVIASLIADKRQQRSAVARPAMS